MINVKQWTMVHCNCDESSHLPYVLTLQTTKYDITQVTILWPLGKTSGGLLLPLGSHEQNRMMGHYWWSSLTHWGRVTHICVSKLAIIASDNGLSPGRHQAIIWTSAGILLIGHSRTNFSEILIEIIFLKIHSRKCIWKCRLWNGGHVVLASMC